MANIQKYLQAILSARYGKDVRQSIHDGIDAVNSSAEGSAASAEASATAAAASAASCHNVELQAEATTELLGAVKYDGITIKKNADGQLYTEGISDISTETVTFAEASARSNIETGESVATLFGKVKKFFTDLKTVAFTGSYNDLSSKPNLKTVATSGSYADLTNTPNLKTVATSGSYNDLTNKPSIPSVTNNLLSTTAGTALDAVQGKVLNDKVTELNSKKQDSSTAINTGNISSQNVNYASHAGNSDTVDGYHANAFLLNSNIGAIYSTAFADWSVAQTATDSQILSVPNGTYVCKAYVRTDSNFGNGRAFAEVGGAEYAMFTSNAKGNQAVTLVNFVDVTNGQISLNVYAESVTASGLLGFIKAIRIK